MLQRFFSLVPDTAVQLLLVLLLSFLVGLEREALKRGGKRTFGGVRTFPLLGLMGYTLAYLSNGMILAIVLGFAVVGGFMLVSYWYKLRFSTEAGITTEISGLVVYLVGALIYQGHYWVACTLVVANLFLLELKESLEGLTDRIAPEEIISLTKFLLLTLVILPLVPNRDFTEFQLNPYRTWLVVVAVSGVSYGSYVLFKWTKGRGGVILSAVLGGVYSSTVTTVVLAKRAAVERRPYTYSGSILAASGMMYLRVLVLVGLFNKAILYALLPSFLPLALAALALGWWWTRKRDMEDRRGEGVSEEKNPLELRSALLFAAIFLAMVLVTHYVVKEMGSLGVFGLSAFMGLTDVDPFIMGLTQATRTGTTAVHLAAMSIVIATASNNLIKGIYAYFFARGTAGKWSLYLLGGLALAGLTPLLWVRG